VRGGDLDSLLDRISERLFGETQPYRYGIYLSSHGRETESKAVLLALAQSAAPTSERAWAYSGLLFVENDTRRAEQYGFAAVGLNPGLLLAHNNLASVAWRLGHSEFAYREAVTGLKLLNGDTDVELDRRVLGNMQSVLAEFADSALGDFGAGAKEMQSDLAVDHTNLRPRSQAYLILDLAGMHDVAAARAVAIDPLPPANRSAANRQIILENLARGLLYIETADWDAAKSELSKGVEEVGPDYASYQLQAPLALVLAKRGDTASARALAAGLPADCYPCVIARARIEALSHNWPISDALFARAIRQGPSIPFAFSDWGASLLARGRYDGAIEKFGQAYLRGPHFADPLEMWGEALMQKNRSDLALVKFEEANKYAPNWGHLHLEWGKALFYAGRKDEAKKQFALAHSLGLPQCDASALSSWLRCHG
jgi:tetratricopeptide (TPR) repeat protein